jgi:predicted RNase H-like HicB family nuclease
VLLHLFSDLLCCVPTGCTRKEVEQNMREAFTFHVDGLRKQGQAGPNQVPIRFTSYCRPK